MSAIRFPAVFEPQEEGGFTVTFPDFPEAITEGDSYEEALFNAAEVLTLSLELRMEDGSFIPAANLSFDGVWVEPIATIQAALLVRMAREAQGKSLADLARSLRTAWPAAQRLEQARNNTTIKQLERAAAALGKRLVVEFS